MFFTTSLELIMTTLNTVAIFVCCIFLAMMSVILIVLGIEYITQGFGLHPIIAFSLGLVTNVLAIYGAYRLVLTAPIK